MMSKNLLGTSDSIIFEPREKGTIRIESNAILQGSMIEDDDPITNINSHMSVLKLSSQLSKTTAPRSLTWNEGTVLSSYAHFKGVDPETNVKLLNNMKDFKCVTDLFVVDEREKKSFFFVFVPFLSLYKNTD